MGITKNQQWGIRQKKVALGSKHLSKKKYSAPTPQFSLQHLTLFIVFLETSPTFKYNFCVGQHLSWGAKYMNPGVR